MKLLLTSDGLLNKKIENALLDLVGKPAKDISLTYVPTAVFGANMQDKRWMVNAIVKLNDLKIGAIDFIDFSSQKEYWLPKLERTDVIYVEGGNAPYLLESIKNSGADVVLRSILKEKVYVGSSAGSMVLGERILFSAKDSHTELGLEIVNFSIRPHYNRPDKSAFTSEKLKKVAKETNSVFFGLDDNSAILIDDDKFEILSEGEWEKFEK